MVVVFDARSNLVLYPQLFRKPKSKLPHSRWVVLSWLGWTTPHPLISLRLWIGLGLRIKFKVWTVESTRTNPLGRKTFWSIGYELGLDLMAFERLLLESWRKWSLSKLKLSATRRRATTLNSWMLDDPDPRCRLMSIFLVPVFNVAITSAYGMVVVLSALSSCLTS